MRRRIGIIPALLLLAAPTAPAGDYTDKALQHLTTLIEHGTDRYGEAQSPIWVLNLDLNTLDSFPAYNDEVELLQADYDAGKLKLYSPVVPYGVGHRVVRVSQRPAGCSNPFVDQPTIRAALLASELTGEPRFAEAAEAYIHHYFTNFQDPETGLIEWGVHTSYDVFKDDFSAYDGRLHELLGILPLWPNLHAMEPEIVQPYLRVYWDKHTNKETGEIDRHHNTNGKGLGFAMAAGEIALACAYLQTLEPAEPWTERARQIAHAHWDARDQATNLFPNRAYGQGKGERFDRIHADTTVPALWASRVLMAGRLAGDVELVDMAAASLKAWARYGWDEEANRPWASLRPDGTAQNIERDYAATSYDKFDPTGHMDLWKDYLYGFEAPLFMCMSYAMAATWLQDEELTAHAERLAACYRQALPANGDRGTFAANYGHAISFFLALEQHTGDPGYRDTARQIADEAIAHLWTGKLFRGFADRTHYIAVEGAGYLVQALIELDADPARLHAIRAKNIFMWNL